MDAVGLTMRRFFWCTRKKIQDKTLFLLFLPEALFVRLKVAVDNCPERMDVVDAEAPRPPRIETVVELRPRMMVESMETV